MSLAVFCAGCGPGDARVAGDGSLVDASTDGAASSDGATGDAGVDPALAQRVQAFVDALCGAARTCCASGGFGTSGLTACETDAPSQLAIGTYVDAVTAGTMTVDLAYFDACIAEVQALSTTCTAMFYGRCLLAFQGTQPDGAPCTTARDCARPAGSAVCLIQTNASVGTCHASQRGAMGGGCFRTCSSSICTTTRTVPAPQTTSTTYCFVDDDLYCGSGSQCASLLPLNGTCVGDTECGPSAYCNSSKQCTARLSNGQTCTSQSECSLDSDCVGSTCVAYPLAESAFCGGMYD